MSIYSQSRNDRHSRRASRPGPQARRPRACRRLDGWRKGPPLQGHRCEDPCPPTPSGSGRTPSPSYCAPSRADGRAGHRRPPGPRHRTPRPPDLAHILGCRSAVWWSWTAAPCPRPLAGDRRAAAVNAGGAGERGCIHRRPGGRGMRCSRPDAAWRGAAGKNGWAEPGKSAATARAAAPNRVRERSSIARGRWPGRAARRPAGPLADGGGVPAAGPGLPGAPAAGARSRPALRSAVEPEPTTGTRTASGRRHRTRSGGGGPWAARGRGQPRRGGGVRSRRHGWTERGRSAATPGAATRDTVRKSSSAPRAVEPCLVPERGDSASTTAPGRRPLDTAPRMSPLPRPPRLADRRRW